MLVKCQRCELNYMQENERYCSVCMREVKGEVKDEFIEICSVCGENPAYPGKDLCLLCLKEIGKSNESATAETNAPNDEAALELGSASNIDEITLDIENEIPPREFGGISQELSIEEAIQDETEEGDEEEDED